MTRPARAPALVLVLGGILALAGCGGAQPSPSPVPATEPPALNQAAATWCAAHTGGPAENRHQVEDMAIQLGVIPGAKTRDDVFRRWLGKSATELLLDPTYRTACIAAYAAFGSG